MHALAAIAVSAHLGLACNSATVLHCERVGLAVFLRQPARSVSASLDGHAVKLGTPRRRTGPYGTGLFWQVFFHDAHAQALADASRSIPVRVRIVTRAGALRRVSMIVYVSEGYG
jgi:hypothetical protein